MGSVKNPRRILDQFIKMYKHVTSGSPAAYYHLKNIDCLKGLLIQKVLETVVRAFVTLRIDYCNCMLYVISDENINRLQRIRIVQLA